MQTRTLALTFFFGITVLFASNAFAGETKTTETTTKAAAKTTPKSTNQVVTLRVKGMSCGGCVARITGVMNKVKGVKKCNVSLEKASATIQYDPKTIQTKALVASIAKLGYDVSVQTPKPPTKPKTNAPAPRKTTK